MTEHMYSAEEAAQVLGLQVRTVRNYVREGRLPGVRIGKQYRIARADLEAFTAGGVAREEPAGTQLGAHASRQPEVAAEVSSVVQIEGIEEPARDRLVRTLTATTIAGEDGGRRLRVEPLYDEERQRLKLIIVGGVGATAELLRVIELFSSERD
ncbi:MAG: helix-turn-helix domain-containing protein [Solirubrobacteraceae bacterium]